VLFRPLLPGSEMGKISPSRTGVLIRDDQPGSYLQEIRNNFCFKILKFFDGDPGSGIGKNLDPGFRMEKIWIRDPG
jgi:hypothetical protein